MGLWASVRNGIVTNVGEWSGDTNDWTPDADVTMVPNPDLKAQIGGGWTQSGGFTPAPTRQPEEQSGWDRFTPREHGEAMLEAMVREGIFTAAKAQAIAQRWMNILRR